MGKQWQSHCHTDVLKKDRLSTLTEFNKILDSISHDNKVGRLFTVDIKFDQINEKTLLFNKIPPPRPPTHTHPKKNRSILKIHIAAYECHD